MAWLHGTAAPKGEKRAKSKARSDRAEAKVKKAVRAACVERDGYCRLTVDGSCDQFALKTGDCFTFGLRIDAWAQRCQGPSEWAHLENKRRAQTRGMKQELRHTTAGTAMLCKAHHEAYDARTLRLIFLTDECANGPIQ